MKKTNIRTLIVFGGAIIVCFVVFNIFKAPKYDKENVLNNHKPSQSISESLQENNVSMDVLVQQASDCLHSIKEPTDSAYISLFDKYSTISLQSSELKIIEEGIYSGIVEISAPDFRKGFEEYVANPDNFQSENYLEILEEILSHAEINTTEHEIFFYYNESSLLSPVITDEVIDAMYGNLSSVYFDEFMSMLQEGDNNEY